MRVRLEATPQELSDKGEALIKALVVELYPVSEELAENLEKALPAKEPALKYKALRDIHRITKEEYQKTLERMHLDIAKVLAEAAEGPSVGQTLEKAESLEKSMGPFIGPRGGKWADPQHTIPWHPDVPHEQIQQDAHAAVQQHAVSGAMRAAAAGAHAPSLRYVGAGGEGMVYADDQGKAHKVSRHRRPGDTQKLRNEAEANQALMGTPAEQYVAKVHNYDANHDVLTRDYVAGKPGGWGSRGLREAYDSIAKELEKKGWTAPEFKEDSFIHPEGGGPPKMVDLGFVNPKGATLANRLKERMANLDPKDDFFDIQLDASHAYQDGAIDLPTALSYVDRAGKGLERAPQIEVEQAKEGLAFTARHKGDLKEGQTWKDVRIPEASPETKPAPTPAAAPAAEPASLGKLREQHGKLSPEEQKGRYFKDRNTGLLNERGAELRQRDPARPMTARFSMEGFKAFNDNFGHEVPDGALRLMGHELSQHIPDGVKRGGDIEGDVTDQAHADKIAEAMSRAIDPSGRIRVVATAVQRQDATSDTLSKLGDAHKAHKDAEVEAGRLGHRLKHPVALGADPKKAIKAMGSIAKRLKAAKQGKGAELGEGHHAEFSKLSPDNAFSTIHQEKSSGLLSDDGFSRSMEAHPDHHVASADLRGVQIYNDTFGRSGADVIIREFSALMARKGGHDLNSAHPHGDEYASHHENPAKLHEFYRNLKDATDRVVFFKERPDGSVVVQKGLHFAYGIGRNFDEADRVDLKKNKEAQGTVPGPIVYTSAEEAHRVIANLQSAGHSIIDAGEGAGSAIRGGAETQQPASGAPATAGAQVPQQLTLTGGAAEAPKPKVRTPVKAKQNPEDAPLPGQHNLFNPQQVVPREPKQMTMFGGPPAPRQATGTDDNAPLPGQLPLIKAELADVVQDVVEKEDVAYRRVKQALQTRGYGKEAFEPGGPLHGKSTNALLKLARMEKSMRIPLTAQTTPHTCGVAVLRAVLSYYDQAVDSEEALASELHTTSADGTDPVAIVQALRQRGLSAMGLDRLRVEDLASYTESGIPVIVGYQSWPTRDTQDWQDGYENGHYAVVQAVRKGIIYVQDPAKPGLVGIPVGDFERRWHDKAADGAKFERIGIVVIRGESV